MFGSTPAHASRRVARRGRELTQISRQMSREGRFSTSRFDPAKTTMVARPKARIAHLLKINETLPGRELRRSYGKERAEECYQPKEYFDRLPLLC